MRCSVKRTAKRSFSRLPPILKPAISCGEDLPIFLITVYAKSGKDNLTQAERNALKRMAKGFFDDYKGSR